MGGAREVKEWVGLQWYSLAPLLNQFVQSREPNPDSPAPTPEM